MASPDDILNDWHGIIDDDFSQTISHTFSLPANDSYIYRAESFAMTLAQIQEQIDAGKLKFKYQSHGQPIEVPSSDITAYTSIFSPSADPSKSLNSFSSNAKRGSPRETVAEYLQSRRISTKTSKSKTHINPYYDIWAYSCQLVTFLGPLPDAAYANPANAKRTHPMLPVLYHHFGCIVPTYEALCIIAQMGTVMDIGSGNGYWSYLLRRMGANVTPVDNLASEYRTMWMEPIKADGVEYVKKSSEATLLMVYPVTAGSFTERVIEAYRGNTIVIAGTQNANRYTGFNDCTAEEWFETKGKSWSLVYRVLLPSFAGKDEAMMVWKRKDA